MMFVAIMRLHQLYIFVIFLQGHTLVDGVEVDSAALDLVLDVLFDTVTVCKGFRVDIEKECQVGVHIVLAVDMLTPRDTLLIEG